MTVSFGFAIPQVFPDGAIDRALVRRILARVDRLGLHSVWVQEQIVGATPSLEPVELLTYAAALTDRVRLGVAVLLTTLRGPVHLAKSLATLDQLSAGRLIVGVGLGGNRELYPAYGIPDDHRVTRFVEGIEIMKRLWTEPAAKHDGLFWRLDGVAMEPKPVQRPQPPLWFGAHHAAAIRRSVALGDGFIGAGASSIDDFASVVRLLRAELDRAGRDAATFPISKRVYIAVDDDDRRAGTRLAEWFGRFYRDPALATHVSVYGPADRCAEELTRIVEAGASLLILNPVFDEDAQLERLTEDVMPRVAKG